jgi:hypothetical protein
MALRLLSNIKASDMQYTTMGFIETLKLEKRTMFRTEFVDPISRATYGWIFQLGPITILKITGWKGEQITAIKIFQLEFVW